MFQNIGAAKREEDQENGDLDNDDQRVCVRRFLDADDENGCDRRDSKKGDKIEHTALVRERSRINPLGRERLGNSSKSLPASVVHDERSAWSSG